MKHRGPVGAHRAAFFADLRFTITYTIPTIIYFVQSAHLFCHLILRNISTYQIEAYIDTNETITGMDVEKLTEVDKAILNELNEGRATKGALVDWTGYSRNSIYNRLQVLEAAGLIICVHEGTRLFELVNDPRDPV